MGIRVSVTGADVVVFGEDNITSCIFTTETPNESNARSTSVSNTLVIKGKIFTAIGGEIEDDSLKIAKWTAASAEEQDAYRSVTVEVISINHIVRKITFPNAFIVDYREDYFDTEGVGTFELKIRQKKDKVELISIEG